MADEQRPPVFIIDAVEGVIDPPDFQHVELVQIGEVRFHGGPYTFEAHPIQTQKGEK